MFPLESYVIMAITLSGYSLTSLQSAVVEFTRNFDTDSAARYQVLAYSQTNTAWRLTQEEVDDFPTKLKNFGSSTWLRESTRGYLMYLEHLIGVIRGKETPPFIQPKDIPSIAAAETLRSEWLKVPTFIEAVEGFIKALEETLDAFNLQLVCNWMKEGLYRTMHSEDKPSFHSPLPWKEIHEELRGFEDVAYSHAKSLYAQRCGQAHQKMVHVPGVAPEFLRFFNFTRPQLMEIAAANRGGRDIRVEHVLAHEPPYNPPLPAWKETSVGLIVPGNLGD